MFPLVIEVVRTVPGSRAMAARVPTTCSLEARPDRGSADGGRLLVVTSCSVMSAPALTG
jgi:hypothetical protein